MAGRQIYNPDGFKNVEENGKITGYQFQFKAQYYRGFTLSIVRDIQVNVDGEDAAREDIRFTVNGETFTLEEMRTVVDSDYRWEFGDYATVTVQKEGGLAKERIISRLCRSLPHPICRSRQRHCVKQILRLPEAIVRS